VRRRKYAELPGKEAEAPRAKVQRSEERSPDPLLDLQQRSGNAAVARLVVQRAPHAASTDAPGHHHHAGHKAAPKPKAEDVHARIIKSDVDQDRALITIASGPDQGVQVGMSGSVVSEKGREVADFVVERASGRVAWAHVDLIQDQVRANPQVVIKASSFQPESMEGKEF
jgi:hypothetical protein